jgi:simple sugar transport system permease protein
MIPIVGMALALSIPFRAGVINLGGEGQMVLGGLAGTLVAIYLPGPSALVIITAIVAGAVAGAAWALLAAAGQIWVRLPILISSLLLSYPARAITSYLVRFPFADPTVTSSSTVPVPAVNRIPKLPWFGGISATILLLAVLLVVVAIFNDRTVAGYETRMTGLNSRFSRYGGVGVERQVIWVMLASGAISGAIGTHLVVGETYRFLDGDLVVSGFAWTGLLVTLLALHRPGPILLAGAFFAALQIGGLAMQRNVNVPWQIALVLQAVVIVMLAGRFVLTRRKREQPEEAPMVEGELTVTGEV